ncbi:MAG: hypothetical protein JEY94_18855 [Melioribacteraceae bacterium]|nr:hypothetical protein [Melioribacteraceae bacterium]
MKAKTKCNILGNDISYVREGSGENDIFEILNKYNPSCVLLYNGLGTKSGLDLLKRIKEDKNYSHVPVIMLTKKNVINVK